MDEYETPNTQMVTEVSQRLKTWSIDNRRYREREIHQLLGGLIFLIFVTPNPNLTRALLEFWDPVRKVFKFTDCNFTPKIEEISDFIDLPYNECQMIVPYKLSYQGNF